MVRLEITHIAITHTCLGVITVSEPEHLQEPDAKVFVINNVPQFTETIKFFDERKAKRPNANPSNRTKRRW